MSSSKSIIVLCAVAFLQSIPAQAIGACNAAAAAQGAFLAGPYTGPYDGFYGAFEAGYGSLTFAEPYAFATPYATSCATTQFAATPYAAAPFAAAAFTAEPYAGPAALTASNGGGLAITSASPIAPTGVSIISEIAYDGPLAVSGSIPFLGAVALEGALPTAGAGAVTYGCGNGNVAMLSEDLAGPTYNAMAAPFGYNGYADAAYGYGMADNAIAASFAYNGYADAAYGYGMADNAIAASFAYNGYADAAYGYGMAGPYGYGPFACGCAF